MTVETVTYISDLDQNLPAGGDSISQGDDHIRNIKKAIKGTFPNVTGEVTASTDDLNELPKLVQQSGSKAGKASCKYNGETMGYSYNVSSVQRLANGHYRVNFANPINNDNPITLPDGSLANPGDFAAVVTCYTTNGRMAIASITDQRETYVDIAFSELAGSTWQTPSKQGFAFMLLDHVPSE